MSVPYNPFEPLDLFLLKEMQRARKQFLVVQRFGWPGVPDKKGFMVTPYEQQIPAMQHVEMLDPKEGKLIDLLSEADKITALINHPQYLLFINNFRDELWASRILKHYQKNIISYLITHTTIPVKNGISIELTFKFGRLKAIIDSKGPRKEFDAYDLVK